MGDSRIVDDGLDALYAPRSVAVIGASDHVGDLKWVGPCLPACAGVERLLAVDEHKPEEDHQHADDMHRQKAFVQHDHPERGAPVERDLQRRDHDRHRGERRHPVARRHAGRPRRRHDFSRCRGIVVPMDTNKDTRVIAWLGTGLLGAGLICNLSKS